MRLAVVVGALGVIFGDTGTSPLHTLQTVFNPDDPHPVPVTTDNTSGVMSLVFLEATERHRHRGRLCKRRPSVRHMELAHGAHCFELECWWHGETWTKDVTVPETVALVRDFVDQALTGAQPGAAVLAARAASDTTSPV
ncbi:KUP/HAK/KT family potassium transporter [Streptomyces sp. NBC_01451]|uniref:KUP/HAK/KT family potassium transporter n=1 Tax=Streptomyces sp. NBC_01451 TaxID=2903872 RepID=UPI002E35078D|nr:KUP/HAK/KT family potassium transporter [Streptomyces sp. NBC_01451]